jgi:catechol 2,3-dioxygenase-like lactoylglutathione lyase family enzyme
MPVQLNHTIVHARNKQEAVTFFREILALPEPVPSGPFLSVQLSNDVTLDFADYLDSATAQHYAFLVTEAEFDEILGRLLDRGLTYYADPMRQRAGEYNTDDGGRGLYWEDPNGHNLEIITRPYGSG